MDFVSLFDFTEYSGMGPSNHPTQLFISDGKGAVKSKSYCSNSSISGMDTIFV